MSRTYRYTDKEYMGPSRSGFNIFKKLKRKNRRKKIKQEMIRENYDTLPLDKKTDEWEFL